MSGRFRSRGFAPGNGEARRTGSAVRINNLTIGIHMHSRSAFAICASASLLRWADYGKVGATAKIGVNRVQTHCSGRRVVVRDGCVLKRFSTGPNLSGVIHWSQTLKKASKSALICS